MCFPRKKVFQNKIKNDHCGRFSEGNLFT